MTARTADGQPPARTRAVAALRRLDRAWTAVTEQLLAEEGTTLAQYTVLTALSAGPMSGAELARRCGVSAPTMSGLLANLSNRDLVRRDQDPAGGRAVLARLTPAGAALLKRCHPHIDAVEAQFLAEVSAGELRRVETVLVKWAVRFEQLQEPQRLSEAIRARP